ncbi:1-acyl-sn-glycerol-3-phosphate acyltransferase [Microlunatus elymi]|uniref:1-acyl-sn-glycerol-3-phosphate acyltransferase n=1 Tax=Microlunatus elymi TaxID=2596828 RepID=A0A516PUH0_9ACTN|nr:lysophospholipid acyltransferase family protein [Microlunatus elymi]QDP94846.1 1-acyl-sn-glycerol-3-phosphate acyltransferase [Microlunatus elymi]
MTDASRYTSRGHAGLRFFAQRGLMRPFIWSLLSVKVYGTEHLDGVEPPYIVVANHSSHLDAPLLMGALPRKATRYLATGTAADYFYQVRWSRTLTELFFNSFPVERTKVRGRNGMTRQLLNAGVPLLLFPEGTRSMSGEMAAFKPGAAALSISQGVPCVPVAIAGAYDAMPKGASWPKSGRPPVTLNIGRPMSAFPEEDAVDFSDRLAKEVRALTDEAMERRERDDRARGKIN